MSKQKESNGMQSRYTGQGQATNAILRLDTMAWSSWHTKLVLILGTGWIFDAFESSVTTSSIGLVRETFNIAGAENQVLAGWITAVWPLGGAFGALFFGYFCDQFGRKKTFLLTLVLYSICTLLTACSPTFIFFLVFRGLTAIGAVGEYSAVCSTISEFVPTKHRGQVMTLVIGMFAIGGVISSALSALVYKYVTDAKIAWRIMFSLPALASIYVVWARRELPESPRFLIGKGRVQEAEAIVNHIADKSNNQTMEQLTITPKFYPPREKTNILRQIASLLYNHPFRTLFACWLDISQVFGGYGVSSFLNTSLLPTIHFPASQQPFFSLTGFSSALVGTVIASLVTDRLGRKVMIPLCYTLAAISSFSIYLAVKTGSVTLVFVAYGVYSACYTAAWNSAFTLYAELFPTSHRSSGIGLAVACGRMGGVISPLVLPMIFQTGPDGKNFLAVFAVVAGLFTSTALLSVPWAIWGPAEGAGRSLEELHDKEQ